MDLEYFWKKENTAAMIEALNKYPNRDKDQESGVYDFYVRLERYRPHIYGVVIDDDLCGWGKEWKLCKIGFTNKPNPKTRVKQVMDEIRSKKKKPNHEPVTCYELFALPISATDTRYNRDVEKDVRGKFGKVLEKAYADKMHLPFPTEWVQTSQGFINEFNKMKAKMRACDVSTAIFDEISPMFYHRIPRIELSKITVLEDSDISADLSEGYQPGGAYTTQKQDDEDDDVESITRTFHHKFFMNPKYH